MNSPPVVEIFKQWNALLAQTRWGSGGQFNLPGVDEKGQREWFNGRRAPRGQTASAVARGVWDIVHQTDAEKLRKSVFSVLCEVDSAARDKRTWERSREDFGAWFFQLAEPPPPPPPTQDDLRRMVHEQMSTPLFSLKSMGLPGLAQRTAMDCLSSAEASGIKTFSELFFSTDPPLELLRLCKNFFKNKYTTARYGAKEQKVAYLFYLLSIVVAKTRWRVQISGLDPEDLHQNVESIQNRAWVDQDIKELFADAALSGRVVSEPRGRDRQPGPHKK